MKMMHRIKASVKQKLVFEYELILYSKFWSVPYFCVIILLLAYETM